MQASFSLNKMQVNVLQRQHTWQEVDTEELQIVYDEIEKLLWK